MPNGGPRWFPLRHWAKASHCPEGQLSIMNDIDRRTVRGIVTAMFFAYLEKLAPVRFGAEVKHSARFVLTV